MAARVQPWHHKSQSEEGSCGHAGEQSSTRIGRDALEMFAVPRCKQFALKIKTDPAGIAAWHVSGAATVAPCSRAVQGVVRF